MAASAGTGKTFALSNRYLSLLAINTDPATIVALTFTRKAAGEILSRILTRLAAGAGSDDGFDDLNQRLAEGKLPGFADRGATQDALCKLITALPKLRIGTLDSFFLQILRQFRLEYGIGAELAISEEQGNSMEDLVLQRLLDRTGLPPEQRDELMETFKLATFGAEEKSVYNSIQRLICNQYEHFQREPDTRKWGNPALIWPEDSQLLSPPKAPDWDVVFADLESQTAVLTDKRVQKGWAKFVDGLQSIRNGSDFDFHNKIGAMLYNAFIFPDGNRNTFLYYNKDIALLPETQRSLIALFAYVRHATLLRRIIRTQGLCKLLEAYGRHHHEHISLTGLMTFNDIAQLLAPSAGIISKERRDRQECRLDARFDHWLLDEFQDTSMVQWAVIANLADEIIQSNEGNRTFFYVGDVKQAIYEWRNGDPRLFRRILDHYNRPGLPRAIEEATALVQSWRSSPAVLDAVNAVFGSLSGMALPPKDEIQADWPAITDHWAGEWEKHIPADKNENLSGYAALHILPRVKKGEPHPVLARTVDLVDQLSQTVENFSRRSVAILVRNGDHGLDLLDALAQKGIRAVWAGNSPLLDNALIPAILSFAKYIEHPGDMLARRHVEMSPLASIVTLIPAAISIWARLIREQGYAGFLARISELLDLRDSPLEFGRLRTLIALAANFDRMPEPTALQFVSFVQAQSLPSEETGSNIQILTMHKAKGLEYDIVVLPFMSTFGIITAKSKPPVFIHEQEGSEVIPTIEWLLSSPETVAIEAEPPLAMQFALDRQGKAMEELRLLYVAMTRAKRALHLITVAPAEDSDSLRIEGVLQNTLAPSLQADSLAPVQTFGSPTWWEQSPAEEQRPEATPCAPPGFDELPQVPVARQMESHIASMEKTRDEGRAGWFFSTEAAEARDLGTRIHALFEQIEWLGPGQAPIFEGANPSDAHLAAKFVKNPRNHAFFERPVGSVELLREQAFESVLEDRWLSGKIDRLHLEKDATGKVVRAHIFDFKTDKKPDADRHRAQMEDYRRAVSQLFSLSHTQITCTLLFVRTGDVIDL